WALHAVAGEPEGMTLTAIAKKLVLHKANAGRLVDRLREKKLVACTRPDHDKRLTIVTVTDKGMALVLKRVARPVQLELLDRLAGLPPRELASIERAIKK